MKSYVQTTEILVLELNAEEAEWLKGQVQNSHLPPSEEPEEDRVMRKKFFNAVTGNHG